jgi:hypothetical protein
MSSSKSIGCCSQAHRGADGVGIGVATCGRRGRTRPPRLQEPRQHVRQRRLAAPLDPDDEQSLARPHVEIDARSESWRAAGPARRRSPARSRRRAAGRGASWSSRVSSPWSVPAVCRSRPAAGGSSAARHRRCGSPPRAPAATPAAAVATVDTRTAIGTSTATAKAGAVRAPPTAGAATITASSDARPARTDTTAVVPACATARRVTAAEAASAGDALAPCGFGAVGNQHVEAASWSSTASARRPERRDRAFGPRAPRPSLSVATSPATTRQARR